MCLCGFRWLVELTVDRFDRTTFQIFRNAFIERLAIDNQSAVNGFGSSIDVCVAVGKAHDKRRANHAAADQFLHEQSPEGLRPLLLLIVRKKYEIARTPGESEEAFQTVFGDGSMHERPETFSLLP